MLSSRASGCLGPTRPLAHSRARAPRIASQPRPHLTFAAGRAPHRHPALASARRSRGGSHVGTGCPTRCPGARQGTGLRDERHGHRVRLGRPTRRAPARARTLAPRAHRCARAGSRKRSRFRARLVGRDETPRRSSRRFGTRAMRHGGGSLFVARASPPRARRRRTRGVSPRDARMTRRARSMEMRGRRARAGTRERSPVRRRGGDPPARARSCWRGAWRSRRRRVTF